MRKIQEKIIEKARKHGFGDSILRILEREDLTGKKLDMIYRLSSFSHKQELVSLEIYEYLIDQGRILFGNSRWYYWYFSIIGSISCSLQEICDIIHECCKKQYTDPEILIIILVIVLILTAGEGKCLDLDTIEKHAVVCKENGIYMHELWDISEKTGTHDISFILNVAIFVENARKNSQPLSISDAVYLIQNNVTSEVFEECSYCKYRVYEKIFKSNFQVTESTMRKLMPENNADYIMDTIWLAEPAITSKLLCYRDIAIKEGKNGLRLSINGNPLAVNLELSLNGFSIKARKGTGYFLDNEGEIHFESYNTYHSFGDRVTEYLFFYNGSVYKKINKKWIPATIKNFSFDMKYFGYGLSEPLLKIIFNEYIESRIQQKDYVWKDLLKYLDRPYRSLPPVYINELTGCSSLNILMRNKYKKADFCNWNKVDLIWGYGIMRVLPRLTEKSRNLLLKDIYKKRNEEFNLTKFIMDRLDKNSYFKTSDGVLADEDDIKTYIIDYMQMCKICRRKINICFTSAKKLKEEHDRLAIIIRNKYTPVIKIPDNSKFNNLRSMLPENFEWIKTRKRIIQESIDLHHCVASYAGEINKDNCAIYSFMAPDEKKYTIEFVLTGKKQKYYKIVQIHGNFDSNAPDWLWEYVGKLVSENSLPQLWKVSGS